MIEIYRRREGKDRLIRTFKTYEDLFRGMWEDDLKEFGYTPTDRTTARNLAGDNDWIFEGYIGNSRCCYNNSLSKNYLSMYFSRCYMVPMGKMARCRVRWTF